MIRICPKCLKAVVHYEKEYITGKVRPVFVDTENKCCGYLQTESVFNNAKCSKLQILKTQAGKISKQLNLSEELKYEFFENLKRFKRTHNEWKDYRVLEEALNYTLSTLNIKLQNEQLVLKKKLKI
ncbi:hypothetical protein [Methanococcus maripaludis]|uniref:Uncharacterized protein n=1 Tax=Methanococcus maripaludis (strain DSM 14266 / JCM 13030 / NBRC 101832 / S2 / LL) TaxID=267377 RepID=Q6M0T0_METMP|nr:hypothetical protein [Methanococcus maripaludis]CAF29745.1 Conserved hypothetical protein [Methanococcus maripaludis S2]